MFSETNIMQRIPKIFGKRGHLLKKIDMVIYKSDVLFLLCKSSYINTHSVYIPN